MKRVPDPKVTAVLPNLSPLATSLCSAGPQLIKYCVSHLEDPSLSLQNFWEVLLRDVCSSLRWAEMGETLQEQKNISLNTPKASVRAYRPIGVKARGKCPARWGSIFLLSLLELQSG